MPNGWIGFRRALAVLAIMVMSACVHRTVQTIPDPLPTLFTFEGSYDAVWLTTLSVLNDERQIPLNLANKDAGILASDWVREERTLHDLPNNTYVKQPSRYRINVSIRRAPSVGLPPGVEKVTVIVNKQLELNQDGYWKAFPSDHRTESQILAMIGEHLGQRLEKKK